jgi:hypothetical protein
MGQKRNAYRLLVGKQEVKGELERPKRRWVDNIKMALGEIRWCGVEFDGLAQDTDKRRALVNTVMNVRIP